MEIDFIKLSQIQNIKPKGKRNIFALKSIDRIQILSSINHYINNDMRDIRSGEIGRHLQFTILFC
ncbi:hypothetical protein SMATCC274_45580 [Serratia marcescens]|nr:hypothetical protein SMATCC274_45580 [Serratia marcescens]